MIVQHIDFHQWVQATREANTKLNRSDGKGEDPYTHFYAINMDCETVGYFGEANGADASHGFLCDTPLEYQKETGT